MVIAVGLTLVEPLAAVDVNVPGVMAMLVAPLVAQLNVLLPPGLMLAGVAPKDVIEGAAVVPEPEFDEPDELVELEPGALVPLTACAQPAKPQVSETRKTTHRIPKDRPTVARNVLLREQL